jgi:hypothetical protein
MDPDKALRLESSADNTCDTTKATAQAVLEKKQDTSFSNLSESKEIPYLSYPSRFI